MTSPEDAAPVKPPPSFSGAPIAVPKSRFDADSIQSSSRPLSSEIRESSVIGSPRNPFPPRSESQSRSSSPSNRLSGSASLPQRLSLRSPLGSLPDSSDNTRSLIIRSFAPSIGVFASDDTEDLIRQKGFKNGLRELLRPFGENITGKVVIRDSTGMSRTWEDYGVRFVNLSPRSNRGSHATPTSPLIQLEEAPLESLRQLYAQTTQGDTAPPPYVNPEFLRYYVLVHDEDRSDIAASTKLYDQMKRHFGLHCHLLRLRSDQCVVTDDDSLEVPSCEWLSPDEDLSSMNENNALIDFGTGVHYLSESDISAINSLVRELVVQSVIPFMENKVALWNDQVASKRRGISGRFMSMSRRWTGFGSSSKSTSSGSSSGMTGNYNTLHGFYRHDVPEAILRKLADFAFMLRDYKLAASTYDLIRSDYTNDKAWKYHAGAHEMCAMSTLLNPLTSAARSKLEGVDQMIDTACYSYLTRCSDTVSTLRCLGLALELLKSRGGSATEGAAKWAMRAIELGLAGPIGQALLTERVSACYASKTTTGGAKWGARHRKAAMWSVLATDSWLRLGKPALASVCLEDADGLYAEIYDKDGVVPMPEMRTFIENLQRAVKLEYLEAKGIDTTDEVMMDQELGTEETSEKLDHRTNRKSLIMNTGPLDTGPISPMPHDGNNPNPLDDDFE
ncbi:hypothetical protein TCE0_015r03071 [Talaromyces pinophilus]|uniref:TRAPP complex protein TRS85 n=1 Tax=Talaromyces pinophilus TaxID=128442 RepID=A0A6V8H174_TALPI|nr:hypothetical protein TCE0_015r03071 [Talaromyces pinophilus]